MDLKLGTLLLFSKALFFAGTSWGQDYSPQLEKFIAAAHYHVVSFTTWPTEKTNINVCIADDHPLSTRLFDTFLSSTKSKRTFKVDLLSHIKTPRFSCDVVILDGDTESNKALLNSFHDVPILTLSSQSDITEYGGMVYITKGKTPKIKNSKVRQTGLRIDSTLLGIAEVLN